mmetsp:Transcript_44698/g.118602  ORF Transcript_44698/g.118602 Transcript_44698/m.118602 type:complete len:351 (+) Transcript_44698:632-1684(+)
MAILAFSSRFFLGSGAEAICARPLKAPGATSANFGMGAAKFIAYAAADLTSGFLLSRDWKTTGMTTGQTGSESSFRCFSRSQESHRPSTRFFSTGSHSVKRRPHSVRHPVNSLGATFMTAPRTSSKLLRQLSSSSLSGSTSSSSGGDCWASFSAFALLSKDWSTITNTFCTSCINSSPVRVPGLLSLRHSAIPSATSFNVSASVSSSMALKAFWSTVRRRCCSKSFCVGSLARPRSSAPWCVHLINIAHVCKAAPRASSINTLTSSLSVNRGSSASAVLLTKSKYAPSICSQKVYNNCTDCWSSSKREECTFTNFPSLLGNMKKSSSSDLPFSTASSSSKVNDLKIPGSR